MSLAYISDMTTISTMSFTDLDVNYVGCQSLDHIFLYTRPPV